MMPNRRSFPPRLEDKMGRDALRPGAAEAHELIQGDDHGDGFAATRQLDFPVGLSQGSAASHCRSPKRPPRCPSVTGKSLDMDIPRSNAGGPQDAFHRRDHARRARDVIHGRDDITEVSRDHLLGHCALLA